MQHVCRHACPGLPRCMDVEMTRDLARGARPVYDRYEVVDTDERGRGQRANPRGAAGGSFCDLVRAAKLCQEPPKPSKSPRERPVDFISLISVLQQLCLAA